MTVGRQDQRQYIPGTRTTRLALPAQFHAQLEEDEMLRLRRRTRVISSQVEVVFSPLALRYTHLSKFDIYGIANYVAITAPVASVGDQLAVPDTVIVSAVRTLAEDGYSGSAVRGRTIHGREWMPRLIWGLIKTGGWRGVVTHLRLPLFVAYLM